MINDIRTKPYILLTLFIGIIAFLYFFTDAFGGTRFNISIRSNPDVENGLVSHWTFDGGDIATTTVYDRGSRGNNGTYRIEGDGAMILLWEGDSLPANWSCISCTGGDPFINRMIKGATEYGGTGGSETSSHTASFVSSTNSAGSQLVKDATDTAPSASHQPTGIQSQTISSPVTLPPHRSIKVIQYVDGEPDEIPTGAIAIFDAAAPAGWTRQSQFDDKFLHGSSTVGTNLGSETHTHSVNITVEGSTSNVTDARTDALPEEVAAGDGHTHSGATTTLSSSNIPPYIDVVIAKLDATTSVPTNMIAMWNDYPGNTWEVVSGAGQAFNGQYLRGSTTYSGTSQGGLTHTHTNETIENMALDADQNFRADTKVTVATDVHTHDVTFSFSTDSHEPPYREVIFGKKAAQVTGESASSKAVSGLVGQALAFDGLNDYINVGNAGTFNTFSFWIKRESSGAEQIFNIDGTDIIEINGSDQVVATSFPAATIYIDGSTSNTSITDSDWHHVVIVDTTGLNATNLQIGRGPTDLFVGRLDDVRMYDRALSQNDISRLYELNATTKIGKTFTLNQDLQNGLLAHWTFDSLNIDIASNTAEVLDASGNSFNGDWMNHATTTASGKIGQAIDLDGTDDYVDMGDPPGLQLTGAMTVSAWVFIDSYGSGDSENSRFVSKNGLATNRGWELNGESDGRARFRIAENNTTTIDADHNNSLETGRWIHYLGVYIPSTAVRLYKDGVMVAENTTSIPASQYNSSQNVYIGRKDGVTSFLDGKVDDVRIYDRALSEEEITRLYEMGATTKISKTIQTNPNLKRGLVGHWSFDGGNTISLITDESGTGNTAYFGTTTVASTTLLTSGVIGQAATFDGTNTYAVVQSSPTLEGMSALTMAAWFKPNALGGANASRIVHKTDGVSGDDYALNYISTGKLQVRVTAASPIIMSGDTTVPAKSGWYHGVGVWDGDEVRLYLNGEIDATPQAVSGPLQDSNLELSIGKHIDDETTRAFDGAIDDVRIYNRALTDEEILRLYQLGE